MWGHISLCHGVINWVTQMGQGRQENEQGKKFKVEGLANYVCKSAQIQNIHICH